MKHDSAPLKKLKNSGLTETSLSATIHWEIPPNFRISGRFAGQGISPSTRKDILITSTKDCRLLLSTNRTQEKQGQGNANGELKSQFDIVKFSHQINLLLAQIP